MKSKTYLIGIDEVGRGPLAGPVTVAAVLLSAKLKTEKFKNLKIPLRDSKKLGPEQREIWFDFVKKQKIPYSVASVSPKIIDKINISKAANLAATKALYKLITKHRPLIRKCRVFLDGGLKILPNFSESLLASGYTLTTIIRGDEKIPAISLASIIAKVRRDKYMEKMHKKFPQYNFKKHKGYGTEIHYKLLKKNGASKIHRKSFLS